MKTYSKDEVLGLAESLAMKASTEEFNGYTSDAELLSCAAGVLRTFAQTLGEPVTCPNCEALKLLARSAQERANQCQRLYEKALGEPVAVPEAMTDLEAEWSVRPKGYMEGWNACREAMLSAAPHHPTTEKGCE